MLDSQGVIAASDQITGIGGTGGTDQGLVIISQTHSITLVKNQNLMLHKEYVQFREDLIIMVLVYFRTVLMIAPAIYDQGGGGEARTSPYYGTNNEALLPVFCIIPIVLGLPGDLSAPCQHHVHTVSTLCRLASASHQ